MFFSGITKNLNWEILTENLVTFKRLGQFADLTGAWQERGRGCF